MHDLHIAFLQCDLRWSDRDANLAHINTFLEQVQPGTDLVLRPETFTTAFPADPCRYSEKTDGATLQWMRQQAQRLDAVVCGTLLLETEGSYRNGLVWMCPDGSFELYHKRHPFSIGGENLLIKKGETPLIVEWKGWRIKPMVCYDIRFPVWARNRYHDGQYDYDFAFYLANFPDSRMVVWNTLLVASAIENQAYIAGINRVGDDPNGLHYCGSSQAVNARGEVLAHLDPYAEGLVHCTLDYEALQRFRTKFPLGPDWDRFTVE